MEAQIPGAKEAAQRFLKYRAGKEKSTPYDGSSEEHGVRDQFARAFGEDAGHYVGLTSYGKEGTEIISMGLQQMMENPVQFAHKDPEYYKFMIGVLDGSLRKKAGK
jgi:hypothetical protein